MTEGTKAGLAHGECPVSMSAAIVVTVTVVIIRAAQIRTHTRELASALRLLRASRSCQSSIVL